MCGFFMRVPILVTVTIPFVMSNSVAMFMCRGTIYRVIMPIAFGMGSAVQFVVGIGFGGLAACEEQGGEDEGCEYVFHWLFGFWSC